MKTLKRIGLWVSIYLLLSIGAVMAVHHSWLWMLPSVVPISLGLSLVEHYARNWGKFNFTLLKFGFTHYFQNYDTRKNLHL